MSYSTRHKEAVLKKTFPPHNRGIRKIAGEVVISDVQSGGMAARGWPSPAGLVCLETGRLG